MKKTTTFVALLAVAALSFSATPAANAATTKACLALDTGGVDDKSFNASAWAGANAAAKANSSVTVKYLAAASDADYAPNIKKLIDEKCTIIVGVGFLINGAIVAAAKANPLTIKFVGAIAENGRLFVLPQIIQAFIDEVARRNGQVSAEVVSAVALDEARQKSVKETVSQIAGSENISLSLRVDPSLIGGLVVRIGSRLIDTSLKTKLNRLEAAMKGVA